MEMQSTKIKTISNFLWRFFERTAANLVVFIVSVVLARILDTELYGAIAIVTAFNTILQVFVDSGLGNALIQKKDADDLDFSTVFYCNMAICITLYALMFFAAPFIAGFYRQPILTPVFRVMCLSLIVSGLMNVQQSFVARNLQFKRFFFATLGGTITAAAVGIIMAVTGFGIWALVAQQLLSVTINTFILWFTVKWRPKLQFSFERLKALFGYGWKLLVSNLLDKLAGVNLQQLVIGKMFTPTDLAFFNRGMDYTYTVVNNVNSAADSVLFPTMSREQDDKAALKQMMRRAIKTTTYVLAPLLMGMFFTAPVLIELLLTDKWAGSVFYVRLFCISYTFVAIETTNLSVIKAMGHSDLYLKLNVIKKVVNVLSILITVWFGVEAVAWGLLASNIIGQAINAWPNKKLLGYGYFEQIKDLSTDILIAIIMGVSVVFVPRLGLGLFVTFALQVVIGAAVYIMISIITKNETMFYLLSVVKGMLGKAGDVKDER